MLRYELKQTERSSEPAVAGRNNNKSTAWRLYWGLECLCVSMSWSYQGNTTASCPASAGRQNTVTSNEHLGAVEPELCNVHFIGLVFIVLRRDASTTRCYQSFQANWTEYLQRILTNL